MNEKLKKGLHIMDEKHILNENLKKCLQNMDEKHLFAPRTVSSWRTWAHFPRGTMVSEEFKLLKVHLPSGT